MYLVASREAMEESATSARDPVSPWQGESFGWALLQRSTDAAAADAAGASGTCNAAAGAADSASGACTAAATAAAAVSGRGAFDK